MESKINAFMDYVRQRNANEPEFLQAVHEVAETVIPFIENNPKYQGKKLLERMVEPERTLMFRVPWVDDKGETQGTLNIKVLSGSTILSNNFFP